MLQQFLVARAESARVLEVTERASGKKEGLPAYVYMGVYTSAGEVEARLLQTDARTILSSPIRAQCSRAN